MRYSFMTFSTPKLSWEDVLAVAARFGYDGVEPRAQANHGHGIEVETSAEARAAIRQKAADAGIAISCLATSCRYAMPDGGERRQMVADSRALIDLAHDIGAPCLRVFGGSYPKETPVGDAIARVADCLAEVADQAAKAGVTLCVETHDSWCDARHLVQVIRRVGHPAAQINWDIMHPTRAGMTIDEAFEAVRPYIHHIHFHDGRQGDKGLELCPIGEGSIDHRRAIELLESIGYQGHLSGEWINWEAWETHLPRELATMKSYEA